MNFIHIGTSYTRHNIAVYYIRFDSTCVVIFNEHIIITAYALNTLKPMAISVEASLI